MGPTPAPTHHNLASPRDGHLRPRPAMTTPTQQRMFKNLVGLSALIVVPRVPVIHSLWWCVPASLLGLWRGVSILIVLLCRRFLDTIYTYAGNDLDIILNTGTKWILVALGAIFCYNALDAGVSLYMVPPAPTAAAPAGAGAAVPLSGGNQLNRLNRPLKSNPETRSVPSLGFSPLRPHKTGLVSGAVSTPQGLSMLSRSGPMQTPPSGAAAHTSSPGAGSPMQQRMTPLQQAIAKAAQSAAEEDASMSGDWIPPNNSFDQSGEFPPVASISTNIFGARTSAQTAPGASDIIPPWASSRVGQNVGPSGLGMGVSPRATMQSFENRRTPSAADGDISWAEDGVDARLMQSLRSQWAASDAADASAAAAAPSRLAAKQGPLLRNNAPRFRTAPSGLAMGR